MPPSRAFAELHVPQIGTSLVTLRSSRPAFQTENVCLFVSKCTQAGSLSTGHNMFSLSAFSVSVQVET